VEHPRPGGLARVSEMVGSVHAFESADLYAKVSGYLDRQDVDIGSLVKKGQVLARIDVPEVLAEAEKAGAALERAEAQVAQATAQGETAKADKKAADAAVGQARAEVGRATAKRNETQKALNRFRRLLGLQSVEQDVVDQREDTYESALAAE